jgi:hypothetical protein
VLPKKFKVTRPNHLACDEMTVSSSCNKLLHIQSQALANLLGQLGISFSSPFVKSLLDNMEINSLATRTKQVVAGYVEPRPFFTSG